MEKIYIKDYDKAIKRNLERIKSFENVDINLKEAIEKYVNYMFTHKYQIGV